MVPIICQIGPLNIYSYGVMIALAVFICAFLLKREAGKNNLSPEIIFDLVFWIVVSGLVGGRLFYIMLNLSYFLNNPSEIFKLYHGGLAWQGGLIGGITGTLFFIKKKSLPLTKTLDTLAPYAALGQAIGRIGCFLNGCCYGKEVAWGIYFPVHQARLHPTQLYDAAGLFLIFLFLKKLQLAQKKPATIFVLYLLLISVLRFFIEFFRADHAVVFAGLSIFQAVSLAII